MTRNSRSTSCALGAVLFVAAITTAHAITITIDNPNQIVVRPDSGTTQVDFSGHITRDEGFNSLIYEIDPLYTGQGLGLTLPFPFPTYRFDGVLFSFEVTAADALGLYAFNASAMPAQLELTECKGISSVCSTASATYSIEVVTSNVPEPAPFALMSLGFVLMGFTLHHTKTKRR